MNTSPLFIIICFTISFIFHSPSSSATRTILVSSESLENHRPRVTKHEHLYEFNSFKAAAGDGVNKLAHGHGSAGGESGGGIPDSGNGGGGAAVPVIIAGAANHHQRRGAATCNIAVNIYWRGLVTLVTAATLASMWKPFLDD
ncbi:hypothetical protein LINPERHAP1_LOCUS3174 [Linum perenne]